MTEDDKNDAAGMNEICPPQVSVFPSERFPAPLLAWEACAFGPEEGNGVRGFLITQPQTALYFWGTNRLTGAFLTDAEEEGAEELTFPEARDRAEEALREWVELHGRTLVQHVETEILAAKEPQRGEPLTALERLKELVHGAGGMTAERGQGEAFSYCMPGGKWIGAETRHVDLQVWAEEQLNSLLN